MDKIRRHWLASSYVNMNIGILQHKLRAPAWPAALVGFAQKGWLQYMPPLISTNILTGLHYHNTIIVILLSGRFNEFKCISITQISAESSSHLQTQQHHFIKIECLRRKHSSTDVATDSIKLCKLEVSATAHKPCIQSNSKHCTLTPTPCRLDDPDDFLLTLLLLQLLQLLLFSVFWLFLYIILMIIWWCRRCSHSLQPKTHYKALRQNPDGHILMVGEVKEK